MKIKKEIIPDLQEIGRLAFEREVTVGNPLLAREGWELCAVRGTLHCAPRQLRNDLCCPSHDGAVLTSHSLKGTSCRTLF